MTHDILGRALVDFYNGKADTLWINNKYDEPEEMPIEVFFREREDITELDKAAIELCSGRVLDIGAGAGANSLVLQEKWDVTAIELSEGACQVMRAQGVKNGIIGDVFDYKSAEFDTLLLLMNGIGLAGSLSNLTSTLTHFKSLLAPDGQIILDSSDISYLYEELTKPKENYFGELQYQYEYKGELGEWFNWLYVDFDNLKQHAEEAGLMAECIITDEYDQYLARLTPV